MSNLRDLLGIVTEDFIKGLGGSNETTKLPSYPSKDYNVQYIAATCGATCNAWTSNYNYYDYPDWVIPTGTTDVIFEIWGSGGGGGKGCCCTMGIPGGSGAYAYKKLSGAAVVPGCSYAIEIGQPGKGDVDSIGPTGAATYITGYSLSNFCANGGHGGCSCCSSSCCNWKTLCEICCNGPCAVYYGADGGAYGNPGAGHVWSQSSFCCNKQNIPYPGGLVNGKGGWVPAYQCECQGCGYIPMKIATANIPWGSHYEYNYVPGVGGMSAWTNGGGCCYGTQGNPGLIRISFK
jgi:hypothetical protein